MCVCVCAHACVCVCVCVFVCDGISECLSNENFVHCIDSPQTAKLSQLDFVFIIRLRYANKTSTLAELIIDQHDKLHHNDHQLLTSILNGRTNDKVLLMMDGYDEYQPGTNRDVDKATDITQGNCLLLLTSRPGYLKKNIRDKMDGEIIIQGFSQQNMKRCAKLFLRYELRCSQMLEQAKNSGIDGYCTYQ